MSFDRWCATFPHLASNTLLYRRTVDGKKQLRKRDPKEWLACIPDAHPGYISWDQNQHNLKVLETNGRGYQAVRASPPREGAALLQGRVLCGRCGSHMKLATLTDAVKSIPGISAAALTSLMVNLTVSRSQVGPSTRQSANCHWSDSALA